MLFIATNGAGLGHLTRSMAIARRLPEEVEGVVLTTSRALSVVRQQGFHVEYFPSLDPRARGAEGTRWNLRLAERLNSVLEGYDPTVVVFDGNFPYRGLIEALQGSAHRSLIWCRRGLWRPGAGQASASLERSSAFDLIIEPGELSEADGVADVPPGSPEIISVGPMIFQDEAELLDRPAAESALGLTGGRTNVLIALGAGNINDTASEAGICLARLRREDQMQVVVAESPISDQPIELPEGVSGLRTYPISRFYRAFDFAVSAAGYNSFHELIGHRVPTLFVPNRATVVDDQVARARYAERAGLGREWDGVDVKLLEDCLGDLLDQDARWLMRRRAGEIAFDNGAVAAAGIVAELAQRPKRSRVAPAMRRGADPAARSGARDRLVGKGLRSSGAVSVYRWLLRALPSRTAERLRSLVWRRLNPDVRKEVLGSNPEERAGAGGEVELLCLALGASAAQLAEIVRDPGHLPPLEPSRIMFVTDCDALEVFSRTGYRFEYVPPRGDWEQHTFGEDYERFVDRRIAGITDAYAAKRVLRLTPEAESS